MSPIKIIGLGNFHCGDDAVGNLVARNLLSYKTSSVDIIEGGMAGLTLLHEMEGTDKLILIDAVSSGSEEGAVFRFTLPENLATITNLAWGFPSSSTHHIGLRETLTLADTLGLLPPQVVLYGIELGNVQTGQSLSPKVFESMMTVVKRIAEEELSPAHA